MFIYSLSDPISRNIRYIGKTNNIKKRLINHLKDKSNCHRTNWISSLKSKKLIPIIDILEECSEEEVDDLERYYISQYKSWGYDLTNSTSGGDGGYVFTDEVKQKMSQQRKGKKQSIESIQKRAEKMCKPILQYTLYGEFFKQWKSIKSAAEFYKVSETSIKQALSGRSRKCVNFQWFNYTENFSKNISPIRKIEKLTRRGKKLIYNHPKSRKIGQYDLNDNLIKTFSSISQASKELEIKISTLHAQIKFKRKTLKHGKFKYLP